MPRDWLKVCYGAWAMEMRLNKIGLLPMIRRIPGSGDLIDITLRPAQTSPRIVLSKNICERTRATFVTSAIVFFVERTFKEIQIIELPL